MEGVTMCSFGDGEEALARLYLNDGCLGRPDDRLQDVCIHHLKSCAPRDEMRIIGSFARNATIEQIEAFSARGEWPKARAQGAIRAD